MLVAKRSRPSVKRTTSMTDTIFNLGPVDQAPPPSYYAQNSAFDFNYQKPAGVVDQRLITMVSPRNHRRHSADFLETPHFLRSCSLCKRRLVPGRDIYMYRGDSAFCSLECRQQEMKQDERKEKYYNLVDQVSSSASGATHASIKGETVAA